MMAKSHHAVGAGARLRLWGRDGGGHWWCGVLCGRARVACASARRGRPTGSASCVQRGYSVCGLGEQAGMQCWLVLRGGRGACGRAARTGHASPAVCALQSHLIDVTNSWRSAAGVAWVRTLRRSPPRRHRRGWQPSGTNLPVVALLPSVQNKTPHQSSKTNLSILCSSVHLSVIGLLILLS